MHWMGAVLNHCTLVALMNRVHQSLTWPLAKISGLKNKRTLWCELLLHQEKQGGHASRKICGAAEVPKEQYRSEWHPRVPYSRKLTF